MTEAATRKAEELGPVAAAKKKQAEAHGVRLHLMDAASEPRTAATVLVLRDDPLRVLLVERPNRGAFPSVLAFPGGSLDPGDRDERAAAVRETREEVGLVLDPADLVAWARWVTPAGEPRRFDTHFFAVRAPAAAEPVVDGVELVRAFWAEPGEALRRRDRGEWRIIPPTAFNLLRLAAAGSVDTALAEAAALAVAPIHPEFGDEAGTLVVRIPDGRGYPVTRLAYLP
jgi:8-oxo-dGTP pyrophosphatase MutT (NUDIX family)